MSSKLPKEALQEIYDLQSLKECYQLDPDLEVVHNNLEHFKKLSKLNIQFYLCVYEEIITETNLLDTLIDILEKNNLTSAKICMSTNAKFVYGTHPLTNIAMWSKVSMKKKIGDDIITNRNQVDIIFSNKHFNLEKNVSFNENRKYKSIFSVRKTNQFRDFLFEDINLGNSICRYAEWDLDNNKDFTNFPTLSELIQEYHNSYISIVCETNNAEIISDIKTPQFSEKSLIAFLSGTMPVIFGAPNLLKNFKDIGLYTWNDYFGFEGDELYEFDKVKSFKRVIDKISNLSTNEVKKLYIENKDKIQSNVNLLSELMNFRLINPNLGVEGKGYGTPNSLF